MAAIKEKKPKNKFTAKQFYAVAAIALILAVFSGGGTYQYHKNVKAWENEKNQIIDSIKLIDEKHNKALDSLQNLDRYEDEVYKELDRSYKTIRKLQRDINSLLTKRYNREYLDSLADAYEFR